VLSDVSLRDLNDAMDRRKDGAGKPDKRLAEICVGLVGRFHNDLAAIGVDDLNGLSQ
jgi:hypothetical protein